MLSITAMGFMPSILVIRAHSYQLAHDEITRQYGSEGVNYPGLEILCDHMCLLVRSFDGPFTMRVVMP